MKVHLKHFDGTRVTGRPRSLNQSPNPVTGLALAEGERWRATAVQDAGALSGKVRRARSVLECASPLALATGPLRFSNSKREQFRAGLRADQRGVALVITLILLTVITFLAVAFLYLSTRERGSVATAVDQTTARLATEAATENAKAEVLSRIMASGNPNNYGLLVSTNYFNPLGFQPGQPTADTDRRSVTNVNFDYRANGNATTAADLVENIANLFYSPRPPVFVNTNLPAPAVQGQLDFRYWLDLNRNGRFETNGFLPELDFTGTPLPTLDTNGNTIVLSNNFVGDPEWVGLLERADRPHGPDNKFLSRWAFTVVPSGKTLDVNTIHNQSKLPAATQDGFSRNMGVGTWEMNLASFLVDLNTNVWEQNNNPMMPSALINPSAYTYNTNLAGFSSGTAFEDALALTRYRYGGNWNNLRSVNQLFGGVGAGAFRTDYADGYGSGPLMANNYLPQTDGDAPTRVNFGWPGADNPNHFVTTQDLYDRNKTAGALQTAPNTFSDRLLNAGRFGDSTYDRYTYYRMLSQLGTDSGPEPAGKLHLNYRNVDTAGNVVPNAQTNFVSWQPLEFFTNAVDQLLRANFPIATNNLRNFGVNAQLTLTNVPVMVSNTMVYSPALHRIFQLAANIVDSSTNYTLARGGADFPSVFRPRFETKANGAFKDVYIRDWVEVTTYGAAEASVPFDLQDAVERQTVQNAAVFNGNLYGVPWVIGAKKGFPNFNEFAMQSISQITRKLQVTKATRQSRPNATNQMFLLGISNVFAVEAWNSYSNNYARDVDIQVANDMLVHFAYTNDAQFDLRGYTPPTPLRLQLAGALYVPANAWSGYGRNIKQVNTNSFIIPLSTNLNYLPNSVYRMNGNPPYFTASTNTGVNLFYGFERGLGFPIPQFTFAVSNRVRFVMLDRDTGRVIDYVQLNDLNGTRDLTRELTTSDVTFIADGRAGGLEAAFWLTNRPAGNSLNNPSQGVINQIEASLGNIAVADWQAYGVGQVPRGAKDREIAGFRAFMYPPYAGNTNTVMQVPFTPTRKTSQYISWQANDPLVHFMAGDLAIVKSEDKPTREQPSGPVTTIANIGKLNDRFEPWGGAPGSTAEASQTGIPRFAVEAKDPGVRSSDHWDFPTNKYPTVGWLGRVHRGTPWQTVYLKSADIGTGTWSRWTGNSNTLDVVQSRPVYDRLLFDLFTTAFDENSTRGQLNVNQDGLAAWSAGLGGVLGITNASTDAQLQAYPPQVVTEPFVIQPAGVSVGDPTNTPLGAIWAGINRTRNLKPFNGSFRRAADVLATPELTVASPLLNRESDVQLQQGIDDATYERLPQMLMGLLRGNDQPRFTIYAYGQTLKPANRSIVTSGNYAGMCTNYQVTAEFATRTVVRIEGAPDAPRAVVESFNVLPPD